MHILKQVKEYFQFDRICYSLNNHANDCQSPLLLKERANYHKKKHNSKITYGD